MAQRRIKGTLVRNPWDFYEASDGICFAHGVTTANSGNGAYFINNSTGGEMVDLYRAEINTSVAHPLFWTIGGPNSISGTPLVGSTLITALDPSQGKPVGQTDAAELIKITSGKLFRERNDAVRVDVITLGVDGPFMTLQPGWGIAVTFDPAGGETFNFNLWYQAIVDQVRPIT